MVEQSKLQSLCSTSTVACLHPHGSFSGYQALDSISGPCTLVPLLVREFYHCHKGTGDTEDWGAIHPSSLEHQIAPGAEAWGG